MKKTKKTQDDYKRIRDFALENGADLFAVADTKEIKGSFSIDSRIIKGLDKAISIGVRLSMQVFADIVDHPTKLYFHHYKTANMFLDQLALRMVGFIQRRGYLGVAIPASQIVDWQKQTSHLSHKQIGLIAGLGWIGRNNLLVNKKFGSQFRLVSVLTNMPLDADKPTEEDCGTCRACIKSCPAGAIKLEKTEFDHKACFEQLKEFQKKRYTNQYICGICLRVCAGR